jgi:beta-lactamase class A
MMRFIHLLSIGITFILFMSCSTPAKTTSAKDPSTAQKVPATVVSVPSEEIFLTNLLKSHHNKMGDILANAKLLKAQIVYSQVDRGKNGVPVLSHHYFNTADNDYFYPASTVKFPIVLLALEKLKELNIAGLHKNSAMITEAAYSGQTAVYNDPNTADGNPSVASYIKKILLVSDNDASNRLYEFLGQDYINTKLKQKGYASAEILHRLSISLTADENKHSNPVKFYDSSNRLLYEQPLTKATRIYPERKNFIGTGYFSNGKLVKAPMDFSSKNKISLTDLHEMMIAVVFPASVPATKRFNISEDDRRFVLQYMSQYPRETVYPAYDTTYYDAYAKFLLFGTENGNLPPHIRLFNKVGNAYGQLTDVAYIVDFEKKIEFFVSATIYCNSDGILNDDKYDYETIGYPFLKNLGILLHDVELKRKRNHLPDLSSLQFTYDK